ncbi:MAG TPA: hypothetical protein VFA06_03065 [Actinocrinis sp.]|uniref:hypothetical protein n=1 Tax=Actinocrinis sp. TaxID=1920516 RepID=UPI002D6BDC1E|nr:hypothetical protein [Actinocrinis sp.]HZU54829.1 hypothetical protein [Actinocrinis sp.]
MSTDQVNAAKGCRAAIAVVTACRHGVPATVADAAGDAPLTWTVVALGHLAAGLLATMPDAEAEEWLRGKALRVAADLADLEQAHRNRDREAT